jgi:alkylation response protein AidB-like acyl-CoA dehydrogenase
MSTSQLSTEEREIVRLVRDFVDSEVRPVVRELEHANTYPEALIEQMKQLGFFGLVGSMGGHSVVCALIATYGTHAQRER